MFARIAAEHEAQRKAAEVAGTAKRVKKHRVTSGAEDAANVTGHGTKIDGEFTKETAKITGKSERTRIAAEHEAQRKAVAVAKKAAENKSRRPSTSASSAVLEGQTKRTNTVIDGEFTKETAKITGILMVIEITQ